MRILKSVFVLCFSLLLFIGVTSEAANTYQQIPLPSSLGPESFAFDCNGEGPYTGVGDGRVFKWQGPSHGWAEFAVPSINRPREVCDGSTDPALETICGRPLGVQFNEKNCTLYIADAYHGLLEVGRNGGVARLVASTAEGMPFRFTNGLDVDQSNGIVYFTDSSVSYQRWQHLELFTSGDSTGRLMKYDPSTGEVMVLLRGLGFANGVALSRDASYLLVAETSRLRILRYWLEGPRAKTTATFLQVQGAPDNIKRNELGEFWVALNNGRSTPSFRREVMALRFDGEARVLEALQGDGLLESVSEVKERNGILLVGSVAMPFVGLTHAEPISLLKTLGLESVCLSSQWIL
ncbi:hypothetical protein Sjap_015214 [Stephania japonica]|uniref:Strictosidine synthase conserved region domain-containing protein n=1 Tax=Stephania japonica TaxID=461633 RepID=A0AAP0IKK4_9MAGN